MIALDNKKPNDAERKHSSTGGEEDLGRSSIQGSRAFNRGSPQSRTSVTISALGVNEDNRNDNGENEDGDNNSPNTSAETEAIVQALLYAGCFFLTNVFLWLLYDRSRCKGKKCHLLSSFLHVSSFLCKVSLTSWYIRDHISYLYDEVTPSTPGSSPLSLFSKVVGIPIV